MDVDKALRLVGIARRARRIEVGEQPALRALRSGKARLALLPDDAAQNSADRLTRTAQAAGVTVVTLPCSKERLGGALGIQLCAMAVVTDAGLSAAIRQTLNGGGTI